jgi:hypothetical protein
MTLVLRAGVLSGASAFESYLDYIDNTGPKTYYLFNEPSGNIINRVGTGSDFESVTAGSTRSVPIDSPVAQYGMRFAGGQDAIKVPALSPKTTDFSMVCWVRFEAVSATNQVFFYNGNGGANGYGMTVTTTGTLSILRGGIANGSPTSQACVLNRWYHLVLRRQGTGARSWEYFINGIVDPVSPAGSANPNVPSGGSWGTGGAPSVQRSYWFMAYYDRPLGEAEIYEMYARGTYSGPSVVVFGGNVETGVDAATVGIALQPSSVEVAAAVDSAVAYVDIQPSGADGKTMFDAATVFTDISIHTCEWYIPVQRPEYIYTEYTKWSYTAETKWVDSAYTKWRWEANVASRVPDEICT